MVETTGQGKSARTMEVEMKDGRYHNGVFGEFW
jgi:hypothetical protein